MSASKPPEPEAILAMVDDVHAWEGTATGLLD